jgi:hypothetical protein
MVQKQIWSHKISEYIYICCSFSNPQNHILKTFLSVFNKRILFKTTTKNPQHKTWNPSLSDSSSLWQTTQRGQPTWHWRCTYRVSGQVVIWAGELWHQLISDLIIWRGALPLNFLTHLHWKMPQAFSIFISFFASFTRRGKSYTPLHLFEISFTKLCKIMQEDSKILYQMFSNLIFT